MFEGTMGSCDVVGIQDGLHVGGGEILRVLACITLGDGPGVGTLGSGVVGNCGCSTLGGSTLGDGVPVASRIIVPWWSVGRGISCSF